MLFAHIAPSARTMCWQPDMGLQPSTVHGLPSSQLTMAPVQVPFEQLSGFVQALPSLQLPATGVCVQPSCSLQPSVVQTFWSSQSLAVPVQVEPEHESLTVHWLPSLQPPVTLACWQLPFVHESVVQDLPSSQFTHALPEEPQFAAAFTKHVLPEMQPVQHVPPRHCPPVHDPLAAAQVPVEEHVRHSPQSLQSRPLLPQAASVWVPNSTHSRRLSRHPVQHAV